MNIEKTTWACRKRLLSFFIMATAVLTASSQTYPPKDSPQLEFALQLRVHISEPYTIGETIYSIRTDDGVNIHVRNRGLVCDGKNADGTPYYYFKAAPQFEAPKDSRYAWLNDALFVCAPEWTTEFKGIVLNVWKVK